MADVDLSNYITVAERLNAFYTEKYPEGRLEATAPKVITVPVSAHSIVNAVVGKLGKKAAGVSTGEVIAALNDAIEKIAGLPPAVFVEVRATAWRSPDDKQPAKASAWEPFPGGTNYTRDSEMMNAETSAIGRVLAMCGVEVRADIASANEVRSRQEEAARIAAEPDPEAPMGAVAARFFVKFAKDKRGLTDEEIEEVVLEATEGRTGEVTGVKQAEWEKLRDIARQYYERRASVPEVQGARRTAPRNRQVAQGHADSAVPSVSVPLESGDVKE